MQCHIGSRKHQEYRLTSTSLGSQQQRTEPSKAISFLEVILTGTHFHQQTEPTFQSSVHHGDTPLPSWCCEAADTPHPSILCVGSATQCLNSCVTSDLAQNQFQYQHLQIRNGDKWFPIVVLPCLNCILIWLKEKQIITESYSLAHLCWSPGDSRSRPYQGASQPGSGG